MALNLAALASEINTDPNGYGLVALRNAGNDQAIADALNLVRPGLAIDRGVIPSYEVVNATAPAEWAALSSAEKQRYQTLTGAGAVDSGNANVRSAFAAMFAVGTTTRANLVALQTRIGSRAEQLFGLGTTISAADVARALRG